MNRKDYTYSNVGTVNVYCLPKENLNGIYRIRETVSFSGTGIDDVEVQEDGVTVRVVQEEVILTHLV